jgi:hypothetical protein
MVTHNLPSQHCFLLLMLQSRGADPSLRAGELEPYLAPGRQPLPCEMAANEEVKGVLQALDQRYSSIPKV